MKAAFLCVLASLAQFASSTSSVVSTSSSAVPPEIEECEITVYRFRNLLNEQPGPIPDDTVERLCLQGLISREEAKKEKRRRIHESASNSDRRSSSDSEASSLDSRESGRSSLPKKLSKSGSASQSSSSSSSRLAAPAKKSEGVSSPSANQGNRSPQSASSSASPQEKPKGGSDSGKSDAPQSLSGSSLATETFMDAIKGFPAESAPQGSRRSSSGGERRIPAKEEKGLSGISTGSTRSKNPDSSQQPASRSLRSSSSSAGPSKALRRDSRNDVTPEQVRDPQKSRSRRSSGSPLAELSNTLKPTQAAEIVIEFNMATKETTHQSQSVPVRVEAAPAPQTVRRSKTDQSAQQPTQESARKASFNKSDKTPIVSPAAMQASIHRPSSTKASSEDAGQVSARNGFVKKVKNLFKGKEKNGYEPLSDGEKKESKSFKSFFKKTKADPAELSLPKKDVSHVPVSKPGVKSFLKNLIPRNVEKDKLIKRIDDYSKLCTNIRRKLPNVYQSRLETVVKKYDNFLSDVKKMLESKTGEPKEALREIKRGLKKLHPLVQEQFNRIYYAAKKQGQQETIDAIKSVGRRMKESKINELMLKIHENLNLIPYTQK